MFRRIKKAIKKKKSIRTKPSSGNYQYKDNTDDYEHEYNSNDSSENESGDTGTDCLDSYECDCE